MAELIESTDDAVQNILTLARYANGSAAEQEFHHDRIKNGKRFIAYKSQGDYLFSPSKFAGYKNNTTDHQYDLDNRDGGITNKRFSKLIGNDYEPTTPGYEEIDNAFLNYCQAHGIMPSIHHRARRYWLIDSNHATPVHLIQSLAQQINLRAHAHAIGQLQAIRAELKGKARQPGTDIFSAKTIHKDWAFHHGGRTELQFNIGLEDVGGQQMLRHGVAFSFDLSQTLPSIDPLISKVQLFNDFLRLYPDLYADMRMWHYKEGEYNGDYQTAPIPPENVRERVFVFLGKRQPTDALDIETILTDFDRLLPLYKFVESEGTPQPIATVEKESFQFRAGCSTKASSAVVSAAQQRLDVNLRHNVLQEALYHQLVHVHGTENVGTENPSGAGNRVDVMVRHPDGFWFYEIKTAQSPRACIREAIGQLLEYSLWPGSQKAARLIVAGESELDQDGAAYLEILREQFGLPIHYEQIVAGERDG